MTMPIYTYRCENCGVQFEKTQKFSDAPLTRCPECNKKSLRKVYTPVGIVFKGSGFYATDNRSPSGTRSYTEHNQAEKKTSDGSDSKTTNSDETASEVKTPSEVKTKSSAESNEE
jgi:putative FmdB family regulatory protein